MMLTDFSKFDFSKYTLPLITVYENPSDFPGLFVARLFDVDVRKDAFIVRDSLDEIRNAIPRRFDRIGRDPEDDPVIVEVWV